jgi:hypothetical protein
MLLTVRYGSRGQTSEYAKHSSSYTTSTRTATSAETPGDANPLRKTSKTRQAGPSLNATLTYNFATTNRIFDHVIQAMKLVVPLLQPAKFSNAKEESSGLLGFLARYNTCVTHKKVFYYYCNNVTQTTTATCFGLSKPSSGSLQTSTEDLLLRSEELKTIEVLMLGCDAVWTCMRIQMFNRNTLPPSSVLLLHRHSVTRIYRTRVTPNILQAVSVQTAARQSQV